MLILGTLIGKKFCHDCRREMREMGGISEENANALRAGKYQLAQAEEARRARAGHNY